MLAYRHSFHAGNHADVLKHLVQTAVLRYLNEKDKPYWVIDTHAGAGLYALDSTHAQRNAEHEQGIGKLYNRTNPPALVAQYLEVVKAVNQGALTHYPGSPCVSAALTRVGDKQRLFELHSTDFALLDAHFAKRKSVTVQNLSGFAGLKSLLPPVPRRALVLIDPSYELKEDYLHVFNALKDALGRFAQGTYMIWYPILNRPEWRHMQERLQRLEVKWLNVSLTVAQFDEDGFGMAGSGLFVVNPPWTLEAQLREVMPYLVKTMGQFPEAGFTLLSHEPKN
jgi:23S rRNA (adenine2030-N6)-methyltransferase